MSPSADHIAATAQTAKATRDVGGRCGGGFPSADHISATAQTANSELETLGEVRRGRPPPLTSSPQPRSLADGPLENIY